MNKWKLYRHTTPVIKYYYGITNAENPNKRLDTLMRAHVLGINTWVSFEPVIDESVLTTIGIFPQYFDKVKIGKLNYHPSDINWAKFGQKAERICEELGIDYYIKDSLRAEMEKP